MQQKRILLVCLLSLVGLLIFSSCNPNSQQTDNPDLVGAEKTETVAPTEVDHMEDMGHLHIETPEEFANLNNPFHDNVEAIEVGEELYSTYCAACHGVEGKGDGPAAEALVPQPASLADSLMMRELSDSYLFWRVSEGGIQEPFNSAMPPWEGVLTEEQRWQVISYIRTLSEEGGHMDDDHMEGGDH